MQNGVANVKRLERWIFVSVRLFFYAKLFKKQMSVMKNTGLGMLTLLACLSTANAANLFNIKPGDVVNGEIQSGKQIYVLPAGDWQVVARTLVQGADAHNAPFPIMNVMFAQIDHLRLVGLVRLIATQTDVPTSRGWKDDPCPPSMKETYFRNTFGSGYNFPECVYARPVLGFGSSGPYWGDVVRRVQESGVEFPPAMVYVDYQYFSGQGFVKLSAWLNPDIAGIDQDKTRLLLDSPWASGNLSGDKKVFVASVRRWSEAMAYAVHRSYTGETVAIPALPNRPAVQ